MKYSFTHPDFNLEATLDSGQVFGFVKSPGKVYSGVLNGRALKIWQKEKKVFFEAEAGGISTHRIEEYFDLKRDLALVYEALLSEECLAPAFHGLR